jgi:predicted dehydrogenase
MSVDRRTFLKGAAALGIGAAAMRRLDARVIGANDRINIAVIGVGGQGRGHFNDTWDRTRDANQKVQLVAACDVWDVRAKDAADVTGGEAKPYRYYPELLARRDVDAVIIATPDHWHAKISIEAMEASKDVYCEKPMTLYWEQAKEVAAVAKKTKAVFQCGAQGASDMRWHKAGEIIAQGGIGPLVWSETSAARNDPGGDWNWPLDFGGRKPKPGQDLDWDFYVGHKWHLAPKMPFDIEKYFRFRKYWAFSGGISTDLLYHSLSHLLIGLVPRLPTRVAAVGGFPAPEHNLGKDHRETPTNINSVVEYPDGSTVRLIGTQENHSGVSEIVRGQYADLSVGGPGVQIRVQDPWRDKMMDLAQKLDCYKGAELVTFDKDGQKKLSEIKVTSEGGRDHKSVWLDCIRTRKPPTLPADVAYKVMVPIALSVMSYREGRMVLFDPVKERLVERKPALR